MQRSGEGERNGRSICAWCSGVIAEGDPTLPETHGLCIHCAVRYDFFEVFSLPDASSELLDRLPFGVIQLDQHGHIIAYNQWESDFAKRTQTSVLGKSFFTEVAPCTNVQSFHGIVRALQEVGVSDTCTFDFVFKFAHECVLVLIQAIYDAATQTTVLLVRQQ